MINLKIELNKCSLDKPTSIIVQKTHNNANNKLSNLRIVIMLESMNIIKIIIDDFLK